MKEQRKTTIRFKNILKDVEQYYTQKIETYGAIAKGADWNSEETQTLRFEQLMKVCNTTDPFSIIDYGCGYGALVEYLVNNNLAFKYSGLDLSERMVAYAQKLYSHRDDSEFFTDEKNLSKADYTVASGIFNVKQEESNQKWQAYVLHTLDKINQLSQKGFAFNILSSYSDKEYMRADLYYADPLSLFDYCKKNFSRFVSLLHDYPLYEFTILVKK